MPDPSDALQPASATILAPPSPPQLRAELQAAITRDLLGPAVGPEEEVDESNIRDRYLVGMLAAKRQRLGAEESDELAVDGRFGSEDGKPDTNALQADTLMSSSFGMSICVAGSVSALKITARWGRYERRSSDTLISEKTGNPKKVWKRVPVQGISPPILLRDGLLEPWQVSEDQPQVHVQGLARKNGEEWIVDIFLVNGQEEPKQNRDQAWLFQAELVVEAPDGSAIFRSRSFHRDRRKLDPVTYAEDQAMSMLYRRQVEFAVGHGVAVHADVQDSDPERAWRITTRAIPAWEVNMQTPPSVVDNPALAGLVLDMKDLAETATADFAHKLGPLPLAYQAWIEEQRMNIADPRAALEEYADMAKEALANCSRSLQRIREGLKLIATHEQAAEAFRFANRAMWLQRIRSLYAEGIRRKRAPDLAAIDTPANRTWHTFQIAFILLNLPALTDLHHPDRSDEHQAVADLLWFPTGGGKTEAYLGLTAYTLGLRRLQGTVAGRSGEHGVAVLMRYTLRLLTLQQFQRAATLICVCEHLRREAIASGDARWGREPFRVGLWVGQKTTPNKTADSAESLQQSKGMYNPATAGSGSPAQLTNCPWCGTDIDPGQQHIVVDKDRGRTLIYCGDPLGRCPFSRKLADGEGLPVLVVDEEIYRLLPALLIATVDKFAQMPWNGATQMLFGQVSAHCPRHGFSAPELPDSTTHPKKRDLPAVQVRPHGPLRPPDLIIQDELHLISGPLGTLVGLYETAVDALTAWDVNGKRVLPKVIASTATIRRAAAQVNAIFLRKVEVFPPHGTDVEDNFFSLQRPTGEEYPGRLYLGICAPGKRLKAALIRVYVVCLAAAQQLYERYGESGDPWMTLVGYFNSMAELAGMKRMVGDDVRSRLRNMATRGLANRFLSVSGAEELTSRKASTDIPRILDRMEAIFNPQEIAERKQRRKDNLPVNTPDPLDVLLATNMISVGVDVKRLGLMVVAGQPKTTAEYIQATSRVGRSRPGLVLTLYNWARPRDLSHYECFEHYHATFYQQVEALSVTPFASRALDRGLTALLMSLIRLPGEAFNENSKAAAIDRQHDIVQAAIRTITARSQAVVGLKEIGDEVLKMLQTRLDAWLKQAQDAKANGSKLGYKEKKDGVTRGLLQPAGLGSWTDFTCLNSLRDVEPSVCLVLDDSGLDADPPQRESGPATSGQVGTGA